MNASRTTALAVVAAVLVTFFATKLFYQRHTTREVITLMIAESVRMETLNDIGRLETFDSLQEYLRKGCLEQAQQFINVQQSLLLGGIARRMKDDPAAELEMTTRSPKVAERARLEAGRSGSPPRAVLGCRDP